MVLIYCLQQPCEVDIGSHFVGQETGLENQTGACRVPVVIPALRTHGLSPCVVQGAVLTLDTQ